MTPKPPQGHKMNESGCGNSGDANAGRPLCSEEQEARPNNYIYDTFRWQMRAILIHQTLHATKERARLAKLIHSVKIPPFP
jgi:hypothetical protein